MVFFVVVVAHGSGRGDGGSDVDECFPLVKSLDNQRVQKQCL